MAEPLVHVVEDDEALRDSMSLLFRAAGLGARTYASGAELLAAAAADGLSGCVVTDLRMPGMSGLDLLRRLRSEGFDLPVMLMSGHRDAGCAAEAREAGACGFFEKPFDEDLFLAAVRQALAGPAPAPPPAAASLLRDAAERPEPTAPRRGGLLDRLLGRRKMPPAD